MDSKTRLRIEKYERIIQANREKIMDVRQLIGTLRHKIGLGRFEGDQYMIVALEVELGRLYLDIERAKVARDETE